MAAASTEPQAASSGGAAKRGGPLAPEKSLLPRLIDFVPASESKDGAGSSKDGADVVVNTLAPAYYLYPRQKLQALLAERAPRNVGRGLRNGGNTCFLNSVVQVLTYAVPLQNYLLSQEHSTSCQATGSGSFCAMCLFESHAREVLRGSRMAMDPQAMLKRINQVGSKSMRLGRQEDAHEFLLHFLDACHKSLLRPATARGEILPLAVQHTTLIRQLFGGVLRSQVLCLSCGHETSTFDPFLDLSLEVQQYSTLEKGLEGFTKSEKIMGLHPYKCKMCKAEVEAKKRFTIETLPPLLTIQLKRFDYSKNFRGKIVKHIHFQTSLEMARFTSQPDSKAQYNLFAVVVHSGTSAKSGHYYAFVRHGRVWYQFDDEAVRPVSEQMVLRAQAYLLFYQAATPSVMESNATSSVDVAASTISNLGATEQVSVATSSATVADSACDIAAAPSEVATAGGATAPLRRRRRVTLRLGRLRRQVMMRHRRQETAGQPDGRIDVGSLGKDLPSHSPASVPPLSSGDVAVKPQKKRRRGQGEEKSSALSVSPAEPAKKPVKVPQVATVLEGRTAEERSRLTTSYETQFGLSQVNSWEEDEDDDDVLEEGGATAKASRLAVLAEAQQQLQPLPERRDELDAEYDVGKKKHKPRKEKIAFNGKNSFDLEQRRRESKGAGKGKGKAKGKGKGKSKGKGKAKAKGKGGK